MKKSSKKPVKKMLTGGMENSNMEKRMTSTDVRNRPAGSQGVTPGVNTAAQRQGTPGSRGVEVKKNASATVNPSKPNNKMYGGKMKMGGMKKGGSMMKKMGKKK